MNREDVIRWARGAGFDVYDTNGVIYATSECTAELERFAALVAAAERNACAKLVEETNEWRGKGWYSTLCQNTKEAIAKGILARGNP